MCHIIVTIDEHLLGEPGRHNLHALRLDVVEGRAHLASDGRDVVLRVGGAMEGSINRRLVVE